jgi:asparagine synthase (glutamine-hydrolysing)
LSGGLDSSAVADTAARFLGPTDGEVFAFTSVPRVGFTGLDPTWYMSDEGPLAAAVAAQHRNMTQILVHPTGRLQTDSFDRDFALYDRPLVNPWNSGWLHEINRQASERGLAIMLVGTNGNMSLTYNGLDVLPEMIAQGRLAAWWLQARDMVRAGTMRWRGALLSSFGPRIPGPLWNRLNRLRGGYVEDFARWTALNPLLFRSVKREGRLRALGLDPYLRPSADAFAWRIANLSYADSGNYNKGVLGGWGVDLRDPTADRRLVEFCLNVPTEQFIAGGVPRALGRRALADRLPAQLLAETRRGYQAADWYEVATAGRAELAAQTEQLRACPPAARLLDLARLQRLIEDWPQGGWEQIEVAEPYQCALLRGLAMGHFLLKASGGDHQARR